MAKNNDFIQFVNCTQAEVPPCVLNDVKRIASMPGVYFDNVFYSYNSSYVVKLVLKLELTTRYNKDTSLVKEKEPVFLEFHLDYPDRVPCAYIGRTDFDFARTPHIYCDKDGLRPICLFRGNGNEWFANMEIEDFIKYLRTWYEDLATDKNIENGDEFEPLRLEGFSGTVFYDYDQLSKEIVNMMFGSHVYKSMLFIYLLKSNVIRITNDNQWLLKSKVVNMKEDVMLGAVCWSSSKDPYDEYDVNLPKTYKGLKAYAAKFGINIDAVSWNIIESYDGNISRFVIILAIRRSKKLIGVNSSFQLVNFEVRCDKNSDGKFILSDASPVIFYAHESPFTKLKAHEMSKLNKDINPSLILAGCGALGSKIGMHLVRAGITNILFSDPDRLNGFNLSRHALLGKSVSHNKADEMKNTADNMFFHEILNTMASHSMVKIVLLDKTLMKSRNVDYILDFTASKVVYNQLVQIKERPSAISAAIYDNGNFGLLICECQKDQLRIDDIFISYLAQYKSDTFISNYLMSEKTQANEPASVISVGLGCNSETFILSDDIISSYASSMSITIKNIFAETCSDGGCWLYKVNSDGSMAVQKINVPTFYVYDIDDWSIRINTQTMKNIVGEANAAGGVETGGYLIGQCNIKNKTIHVIDNIEAPADTEHRGDYVVLGKEGYKKKLSHIECRSGATFGYVGEWHSHPNGPNVFSETDVLEFEAKVSEMNANGGTKPILEVLVTPFGMSYTVLSLI